MVAAYSLIGKTVMSGVEEAEERAVEREEGEELRHGEEPPYQELLRAKFSWRYNKQKSLRKPFELVTHVHLKKAMLGRKFVKVDLQDQLDVDPRRDDNASPMSSYRCMLRPTWKFMDRMIAPINVFSIS